MSTLAPSKLPRTFLITLDAFGTLYRPRRPIAAQYLDIARSHGLDLLDHLPTTPAGSATDKIETALSRSFHQSFQSHSARHPNYGRGTSDTPPTMQPAQWWANVVHDTFSPLLPPESKGIPEGLAEELYRHFSTAKAYELYADVAPFLEWVRGWKRALRMGREERGGWGRDKDEEKVGVVSNVLVGVLTNSDPRAGEVLEDLGLRVGRSGGGDGGGGTSVQGAVQQDLDLDFVLTSFDIGHEKPDPAAFAHAEQMLASTTLRRWMLGGPRGEHVQESTANAIKVHIGDDVHRDYWGAVRSGRGWDSMLLDREAEPSIPPEHGLKRITRLTDAAAVLTTFIHPAQRSGKYGINRA